MLHGCTSHTRAPTRHDHYTLHDTSSTMGPRATLKLSTSSEPPDSVGGSAGKRLDCQRWIDPADRREDGPVADEKIADVPAPAIRIDDTRPRVIPHPCGTIQMTGVIGLFPDVRHTDDLQSTTHELQGVIDQQS